ncbi:MAG: hypothetical protein RL065_191 [Bacteroidota bacterium]
MIKKITLLSALAISAIIALDGQFNLAVSDSNGASMPASGDPASSGATCNQSGCHTGGPSFTPTPDAIVIKDATNTNVVTSYNPGTAYKVNVKLTSPSTTGGFQLTVEDAANAHQGTLTAGSDTRLRPNANFITHKFSAMGAATKTWTFDWTAPAASSGTLTFYAALNKADGNGGTGFDTIGKTSVILTDATTGINNVVSNALFVSPNPASTSIYVHAMNLSSNNTVSVYSITGELMLNEKLNSNHQIDISNLNKGVYLVQVSNSNQTFVKKFIKE